MNIYYLVSMFVCAMAHVWRLWGLVLYSDHQDWWHVPLPVETYC